MMGTKLEDLTDYRKQMAKMAARLSKPVQSSIAALAKVFGTSPKLLQEDFLWRAAGNSLRVPTNIARGTARAYERCLSILRPQFASSKKTADFERQYFRPIVDMEKKRLPDLLNERLIERLSEEAKKKLTTLELQFGRTMVFEVKPLARIVHLTPLAFAKYEADQIVPFLDYEIERCIEKELVAAGLAEKPHEKGANERRNVIVRVAPVKWLPFFDKVDRLKVANGYSIAKALETVFNEEGFDVERGDSLEGFEKAYRRHRTNPKKGNV